ncbi:MAG: hypothetical protein ACTHMZ_04515 [Actinomycetes bacterium]
MAQGRLPALPLSGLAAGVVASATAPARLALRLLTVASSAVGEPAELEMLVRAHLLD